MDKIDSDNPGDCRIVARADSTTKVIEANNMAPTITTREGLRRHHQQQQQQQQQQQATTSLFKETQQQVSSTTTITSATTTTSTKSKSPTPPPNKLKAQQQQQHHQFRAPQQFVKQCKNATSLKKQKTWSKRQHNKMCKQNVAANLIGIGQVLVMGGGGGGGGTGAGTTSAAAAHKADLENIQNVKNQIHHSRLAVAAVGNIVNPQVGVIGGASGVMVPTGVASVGVPTSIIGASSGLEKLGHCHGHLKPQTYKKMLTHGRGGVHHNHVLCAGAAHNTQAQCCLANGCTGVSGVVVDKDNTALSGVVANNAGGLGNAAGAQHYCCGRSKFFLPEKRIRKEVFIPPTKFLLGGNISDPLNLNSLQNETSSNANSTNNTPGTTPRQSPITTPPKVEVIIPPNIHDPLHLLDPVDSMEYEKQLTSPMKRGGILRGGGSHLKLPHHGGVGGGGGGNKHRNRKNRKRRSRNDSETSSNNASTLSNSTLPTGGETTTASLMSLAAAMTTTATTTAAAAATEAATLASSTIMSLTTTETPPLSISLDDNGDALLNVTEQQQKQQQNNLLSISDGTKQIEETSKILKETACKAIKEASVAGEIDGSTTAITERLRSPTVPPTITTMTTTPPSTSSSSSTPSELLTRAAVKRLERETETAIAATALTAMPTMMPNIQQQHVEANVAPLLLTTASAKAAAPTARRVDLHLDLSNLSSTCYAAGLGSVGSSASGIIGSGNNGFGRKRKISESNNSQKSKKFHRHDGMDKIVSPVVPQPGTWKRPPRLQPTGARKPNLRRSTSFSESEVLSPIDEVKLVLEVEIPRDDTPDFTKGVGAIDTASETFLGSPLSTISAATSLTMGEQDSLADVSLGDASTVLTPELKTTDTGSTASVPISGDVAPEATAAKGPKFRADGAKFRYGNFDRYVDYRQIHEFRDVRLQVFQRHLELFQNKDILDIGCNVGHMTITVARNLAPKSILGIDIDRELVARARRNLSMFVRIPTEPIKPKLSKNSNAKGAKQGNAASQNNEPDNKEIDLGKKHKKTRRKKRRHGHGVAVVGEVSALENQMRLHYLLHHHHHQHFHHFHHYHSQQEQMQQQKLRELHVDAKEFFPISFPLIFGGIPSATLLQKLTGTTKTTPSNAGSSNVGANAITSTSNNTPGGGNTTTNVPAGSSSNNNLVNSTTTKMPKHKNNFPQNVFFRHLNYVLKDEALLANDTQQYDLILCLSVTKWIHLNFGDAGLKLAFKRMFNQLRPGGKLILEAQNWASYKKKKNLTPEIYEHYKQIEFFPNKFHEYLLSSDVGFSHSYTLGVPRHMNKGFSRPIQLYAKGDYTPNHVRWSDAYYPQTPYEAYRGIYATMAPRPLLEGSASGSSIGGIATGGLCIGSGGGGGSTGGGSGGSGSLPFNLGSTRSQNYDTPHYTGGGSGSYSCRQTPMHQPTSQYYNPLETDSYQPSYDMEYLNHMYVFASPLYQTVWSPPASLRKSSSHTPVFGSVREAELDGDGSMGGGGSGSGGSSYHRHVYPPNDDTCSPNANAGNAFNSIRDPDTDDSNQLPAVSQRHVYATTVNCGESSSSPQVNHHDSETIEALMLDEDPHQQQQSSQSQQQPINNVAVNPSGNYCDQNDA